MGIKIDYRGKIDRIKEVDQLSGEISEYAAILNWDIRQWNENWDLPNSAILKKGIDGDEISGHIPIRGISLTPDTNCDPLFLTFCKDGTLVSTINMVMMADKETASDDIWLSTQTHFSSAEIHIAIIKLLRFLKNKYISNLDVRDSGSYWENDNDEEIKEVFKTSKKLLKAKSDRMKLLLKDDFKNKTPEEIADLIEKVLRNKSGS